MFAGVLVDLVSKWSDSEELPFWWNDASASAAMVVQRTWTGGALQVLAPIVDWQLITEISKLMMYAVTMCLSVDTPAISSLNCLIV